MGKRLWEKDEEIDKTVHAFTVGSDPFIDLQLVRWDLIGSAAHARMLTEIHILTREECSALLSCLKEILVAADHNRFNIPVELEDCHTAIEAYLVKQLGDVGEKIHTGRSRNDQVILTMRLYLRHQITLLIQGLHSLGMVLSRRFDEMSEVPMPGYTHLQRAMPSSVGMWLHAFYEACLEFAHEGLMLLDLQSSNPLGAAAGFGVPLPLDRNLVTKLLGFNRLQRSPIDVQNSRGRYELRLLNWCSTICNIIEKIAWDLQLYSTEEFGFFSVPKVFTTGSSIMPQKHNPDVLELLRARCGQVHGARDELLWIIAKLPSNYHRDLQLTKEPMIRAVPNLIVMLSMVSFVVDSAEVNVKTIEEAMTSDLYATYEAYSLVRKGVPFREAYRQTAERLKAGTLVKDNLVQDFTLIADSTKEYMAEARAEMKTVEEKLENWRKKLIDVENEIFVWE